MAISHAFTNLIADGTNTNVVRPSDWNSAHNQYYTLSGNTLGVSTVSGTNVVFQGVGNVSLSGTGQTIVFYGTGGGTQSVQTQASGNIAGIGFTSTTTVGTDITGALGTNGISIAVPAYLTTARATTDGVGLNTAQTNVTWTVNSSGISLNAAGYAGTVTAATGASVTLNSAGLTISAPTVSALSNGNNITISNTGSNVGVSAQAVAAAAGAQTATSGTVNFANSNGITFGMSGSNQITASHNGITSQTVQTQASGNIARTGFTSTTTTGTAIVGTLDTNGLNLGVPAYVTNAVGGGGVAIGASTQTATSGTVIFSNSNGITFGLSNGTLTASAAAAPTAYVSSVNGSSGAISLNVGSSLSSSTAGSSITFGLASNITTALQSANANYLTSQSNQAFSASGGSSTFQTLNFANSNGVTFSNSGGSVVASYTVPTVPAAYVSSVNGSSGAISLNVGSSLSASTNGSSITFGLASNITTALQSTGNYLTTARASNDAVGLNTAATNVTWTVNSSGISLNAGAYLTTQSVQTQASGAIAGTGFTSTTTAGTAITAALGTNGLSMAVPAYLTAAAGGNFSGGVSNLGNTAGSTGITGTRIVFVGTNNISLSQSTDANGATISINQTGGGGGLTNINVSAGTTSNNLSNIIFSNGNGVTFGLNGSTVTASVAPQYTLSGYNHYNDVVMSAGTVGQGALIFDHINLENAVQFDRYGMLILNTNSSNSSGSHTISFWVGLYTKNGSTISLLQSTSTSVNVSQSGTVGSYSLFSGIRQLTIPFTTTLTRGEYFLGVVSRTTSAGQNGTYSQMRQSNFNSSYRGLWGSAVNATNQVSPGMGLYSATTSGLPGSIAFSQIDGTNADVFRPPVVIFQSGTY